MMRLALAEDEERAVETHFTECAPRESGAFFLLRACPTPQGIRLVASRPHIPSAADWDRSAAHQLEPSARLLSAMVSRANETRAGLLFVHSHPHSHHPPGFSHVDDAALDALAEVMPDLLDGPFGAGVVSRHGWVAKVFHAGRWVAVDRVVSAGKGLRLLSPFAEGGSDAALDDRQQRALGSVNRTLRTLDVAIVGCGGLGSPLAETLTRMGVRRLTLVDHDVLDTPSNVRRVFGAKVLDLSANSVPSKVAAVGDLCRSIGLETEVVDVHGDVRQDHVFRHLLGVDVVFSATDSHSSRAVIDAAAVAYHLPVIDAGTRAALRSGELAGLVAEVRILAPGRPCLWCRGTLSADRVRAENLPDGQRQDLEREGYLVGGTVDPEPSVTALTVLGAGAMACALLALLSPENEVLQHSWMFDGLLGDAPRLPGGQVDAGCICQGRRGRGDDADPGLRSGRQA